MSAYGYHRTVARAEIGKTIDAFCNLGLQTLYYEARDDIGLIAYRTPAETWTHARAFGEQCEVRWTWNGATFDVIVLTENASLQLPGGNAWQPVYAEPMDTEGAEIRLWGKHRKDLKSSHYLKSDANVSEWIETRVPRILVYPGMGTKTRVQARGVTYRLNAIPIATRWQKLEGWDE